MAPATLDQGPWGLREPHPGDHPTCPINPAESAVSTHPAEGQMEVRGGSCLSPSLWMVSIPDKASTL